jgi:hypothetical protein
MCKDSKTPFLRTYTVRFIPQDIESVRVNAQGFRRTENGTIEFWRRTAAGADQVVGEFPEMHVLDMFEDADPGPAFAPESVPDEWTERFGTKPEAQRSVTVPAPPSDDDVPF